MYTKTVMKRLGFLSVHEGAQLKVSRPVQESNLAQHLYQFARAALTKYR